MYQSPKMASLNASAVPAGFESIYADMMERAKAVDQQYVAIMIQTTGNPLGLEFKKSSSSQWAFISPEMSEPEVGPVRLQRFDGRGFYGHETKKSAEDALESLLNEGFNEQDPGALDRICTMPEWHCGTETADLIRKLNCGWIPQSQFTEQVTEIRSRYAVV